MKTINYKTEYQKLLTPEIVYYLAKIHEQKGQQNLYNGTQREVLSDLLQIAIIQSTESSNWIEGVVTTDERLKKLVMNKTTPKGRSEREIAGYRDVLNTIHENHDFIPIRPGMILQLHRDLYKYSGTEHGGSFKNNDNVIVEELADGTKRIRFKPVPAWETPEAVDVLCKAFQEAIEDPEMDPLLIMPMFILDFLCIHPFNDGNGRMSRLLTLLLLYQAGFFVGKYISIDRLIASTRQTYYQVLQDSSMGWYEGENDYLPFTRYMLEIITSAYRELFEQADLLVTKGLSKPDRVREIIRNTTGRITKSQIMAQCPDISQKTVERALKELLDNGSITKIGGGRYTYYTWNWKTEK